MIDLLLCLLWAMLGWTWCYSLDVVAEIRRIRREMRDWGEDWHCGCTCCGQHDEEGA